jgi:Bacterial Ig-like domain (group 3)/Viral BACON domain
VTLQIIGNSLEGVSSAPCSGPPESVTLNATALSITSASDTEIDVTVPANLLTSIATDTVTVSVNHVNGGACQSLTASGTVQVVSPVLTLGASPSSLTFSALPGTSPFSQSVQVTSTSGTLAYSATVPYASGSPTGWLLVSPSSGNVAPGSPASLTVSIGSSIIHSIGTYQATISITSGFQTQTVAVTLSIYAPFSVPSTMVFGAISGALAPTGAQDSQTLAVTANGAPVSFVDSPAPVNATPSGAPTCANSSLAPQPSFSLSWLSVPTSGVSGQNLAVYVQPSGLAPGTYINQITFGAGGFSTSTEVYMVVQNPLATFNFSSTGGSLPAPQTTNLFTSGCGVLASAMTFAYESDQSWLSATLNQSGETFSVTMTAHPTGLGAGTYHGAISITDTSGEVWTFAPVLTVSQSSKASTATDLALSANPALSGQTVILTASVTPKAATGTVVYYDGPNRVGSATLSAGAASVSMSFAAGYHALTASYSGDASYSASTSTTVTLGVNSGLPNTSSISLSGSLRHKLSEVRLFSLPR